jgi:hypothetical protein
MMAILLIRAELSTVICFVSRSESFIKHTTGRCRIREAPVSSAQQPVLRFLRVELQFEAKPEYDLLRLSHSSCLSKNSNYD